MSIQDDKRRVAEELASKASQIVSDPSGHALDDIGVATINIWLNDWLVRLPGKPQTGYTNVEQVYENRSDHFDADDVLRSSVDND